MCAAAGPRTTDGAEAHEAKLHLEKGSQDIICALISWDEKAHEPR